MHVQVTVMIQERVARKGGEGGEGRWGGAVGRVTWGGCRGKGETGKGAKGRGRRRDKRRGMSQMDMMGGHVECLGGIGYKVFFVYLSNAGYPSLYPL